MAGIVVALAVAFHGGGAWALVWQHLTQRIVKGVVVQLASRLYPRLVLNFGKLKEHLRFMLDTAAWSMTMFVNRQADTLIVGKFLGAATLGLYNIAVRIMQLPVSILGGSLHSAIYPRFVQLREDNKALRELVLFTTMAQAVLVFPASRRRCCREPCFLHAAVVGTLGSSQAKFSRCSRARRLSRPWSRSMVRCCKP